MAVGIDLHLTEQAPLIAVTQSVTDSGQLGASDATPNIVIVTLISATDSCTVQASDVARAPVTLIPSVDSLAIVATDVITTLFKSTEGIPLHMTETATVAVVQPVVDTFGVTASDLAAIFVPVSVTDTLPAQIDDGNNAHAIVQFPVADSCAVQASDASTLNTGGSSTASISASDTITCGLTDGPPPEFAAIVASDVIAVGMTTPGFGEDVNIFAFTPQQFVQITVTDTCVVQVPTVPLGTVVKTVSDTCAIQAIEPQDSQASLAASDSARIAVSDVGSQAVVADTAFKSAVETLSVTLSESASVVKTTIDVFLSVADSLALPTTEAIALASDIIFISASDSARISLTDTGRAPTRVQAATDSARIVAVEPTDAMSFPNPFDSLAVQASDARPAINGVFSFNVSDGLTVQATESTPTFPLSQAVLTSDNIKAVPVEGGQLIAAVVSASETLQIGVNDASLLLLKFLALTDTLGMPTSDAATLFNAFIAVVATDTNAVQAVDVVNFLQQSLTQLATTESLAIGITDDQTDIAVVQSVQDQLLTDAQEFVTLLKALSVTDSLAYRINAENANIINPFVVISTIFVDDVVTSDVLESTLGMPSRLSFFVTDECALPLDDVAVTEEVVLPEVLDFQIPTSYTDINNPQSYETVTSNVW